MSRPLRIEYPGAWYHVMNRGRRGNDIFLYRKDSLAFVDLLRQSADRWNVKLAACYTIPPPIITCLFTAQRAPCHDV